MTVSADRLIRNKQGKYILALIKLYLPVERERNTWPQIGLDYAASHTVTLDYFKGTCAHEEKLSM